MTSFDVNIHIHEFGNVGEYPVCTEIELTCRKCSEKFRSFAVSKEPDNEELNKMEHKIGQAIRLHAIKHIGEVNGGWKMTEGLRKKPKQAV